MLYMQMTWYTFILNLIQKFVTTLRKKCYWIKRISFQKHVYPGFKSICYRISNIFIGSCSIFLWINSINAFGKKCFWFNSILFSVHVRNKNWTRIKCWVNETLVAWYFLCEVNLNLYRICPRPWTWPDPFRHWIGQWFSFSVELAWAKLVYI